MCRYAFAPFVSSIDRAFVTKESIETGQQFGECHAWKLLSLGCRGRLLVLHEGVCLMTADTRLAFHEGIRLQLCHLIGVTGVACA